MWIDDDILERCDEPAALACWIPEDPIVVLGSSNDAAIEADEAACAAAGIPILRRYGGGGTVLLHSGCVVLSYGAWVRQHFQNKLYFELLNAALIDCLAGEWSRLATLTQRGLSDIVQGDLKVAGTSLFRSRNYLLYQVSLLIDPRIDEIARFLKHPSKEPDYRRGRSHAAFVTGLGHLEVGVAPKRCLDVLTKGFPAAAATTLGDEMIAPIEAQYPTLRDRAARGRAQALASSRRPTTLK